METFKKSCKWGMCIAGVNLILGLLFYFINISPHSPFYILSAIVTIPFIIYFASGVSVCGGGWVFGGEGIINCGESEFFGILVGILGFLTFYLFIGFVTYSLGRILKKRSR